MLSKLPLTIAYLKNKGNGRLNEDAGKDQLVLYERALAVILRLRRGEISLAKHSGDMYRLCFVRIYESAKLLFIA